MEFGPGEMNVICTNLERSLAFYRDVLGYRVIEEDQGALRLGLEAQILLLLPEASKPAAEARYCERAELSFDLRTGDLEAAARHFESCGVELEKPWSAGDDFFVIKDPDGLHIEIVGR